MSFLTTQLDAGEGLDGLALQHSDAIDPHDAFVALALLADPNGEHHLTGNTWCEAYTNGENANKVKHVMAHALFRAASLFDRDGEPLDRDGANRDNRRIDDERRRRGTYTGDYTTYDRRFRQATGRPPRTARTAAFDGLFDHDDWTTLNNARFNEWGTE